MWEENKEEEECGMMGEFRIMFSRDKLFIGY